MRVPIRKPGKYSNQKFDQYLTQEKFDQFKNQLDKLKNFSQPKAIAEVQRLAELGDFSENAAYQMAKGKLRGINQKILELEQQIKQAKIIKPVDNVNSVQIGNRVTIEIDGLEQTYLLLGSTETNPTQGVISYQSPIGSAIINHQIGDIVLIKLKDKVVECRIVAII
ncbi:MAG: GreA/GreB family elongation factor [Candidatus Buchananbacteria bacterium]|nr:GreA/GreB family elongation factor [Candidatus Buchananbacteria bacterium]